MTSLLLFKKRFPETGYIYFFGIDDNKMKDFLFAEKTFRCDRDPHDDLRVDHAFECIGGPHQGLTGINQSSIISVQREQSLYWASRRSSFPSIREMVLEKGLTIFGSSRSGVKDFQDVVLFFEENPEVVDYLKNIVDQTIVVHSIKDMNYAFDEDIRKAGGKTVMAWEK